MNYIHLLDSDTVNKIAAGEVVERPSSVVKELVENSIDAGSTAVTAEIRDGGIGFIRVTDNGCGIGSDDIETAFERHATSKISNAGDLQSISSLGFRGEALSSIAAVSQVEMITKTHTDLTGIRYRANAGIRVSREEVGCPDGTTIIVRNLFYNIPARRKFLKMPATEAGYISDLMARLALSHPEVSFKFINNGKEVLHTSGNGNLRDIIYQIYGKDISDQLLDVDAGTDPVHVAGFIGKPVLSRGNRSWENYFINGRYIKSDMITRAVEDAYKTFVMVHKYPFTVLHISVDPSLTDVNVHPRKMEIRFNQNDTVYAQLHDIIRSVLEKRELIPSVSFGKPEKDDAGAGKPDPAPEPFEVHRLASMEAGYVNVSENAKKEYDYYTREDSGTKEDGLKEEKTPWKMQPPGEGEDEGFINNIRIGAGYRLIGQVFGTYWLIEYGGKLFIMDQHAAHEKVLYERFMSDFEHNEVHSQMISPPVVVSLSLQEENLYNQYKDEFAQTGFEVELFGGREYAIHGVPLQLFGMSIKDIFIEILDSLSEESGSLEGTAITYAIATMACKAAVKGNSVLSFEEADSLISQLLAARDPYTCPHGRPTIISISKYELEKRFKRIQ